VLGQVRDKLRLNCAAVQVPLGVEDAHRGLVDLIEMRAFEFHGPNGEQVREARLLPDAPAAPWSGKACAVGRTGTPGGGWEPGDRGLCV